MRVWIRARPYVIRGMYIAIVTAYVGGTVAAMVFFQSGVGSAESHMPCTAAHIPMMSNVLPDIRC